MPKKSVKSDNNLALTAVAFQDHILKNLNMCKPKDRQRFTVTPKQLNKKVVSIVDSGLKKKTTLNKDSDMKNIEKEYVLDKKPPLPSLAQKLGLIDYDKRHLSEEDWGSVKKKSNDREDSKQGCVICREMFDCDKEQVLLSCSHVFHRQCLSAFERFSGKKTCPMCRNEEYQKRIIYEGARYHRNASATKIQSTWKMYKVRKWYLELRTKIPPKDKKLRKKFFEEKLTELTTRVINQFNLNSQSFLNEIDTSLAKSRLVFEQFDKQFKIITPEDWDNIQCKALVRNDNECSICLNCFDAKRKTVLLSCSHCFHEICLNAFEKFTNGLNTCPVCRSDYKKLIL